MNRKYGARVCGYSGLVEETIKLLGIVGSPRKGGNTEIAMREALNAAVQEGAETEMMRLADYDLKPCEGCMTCRQTRRCAIEDDVEKLYDKVTGADGIIIGGPVYLVSLNSHTKVFIERLGALIRFRDRVVSRNKVGGAFAVAGRGGTRLALSQIFQFYHYMRVIIATPAVTVLAGLDSVARDALRDTRGINEVRELGRSMVQIARATASLREI